MNIALWVIQGLLAALFLFAGGMKLFAYDRYKKMGAGAGPGRGAAPLSRTLIRSSPSHGGWRGSSGSVRWQGVSDWCCPNSLASFQR